MILQFKAASDGSDFAVDHDGDLVADLLGLVDDVRALEHCILRLFVFDDVFVDALARDRVHTGGRFVQKEQFGVSQRGDGLVEFALVAAAQRGCSLVFKPFHAQFSKFLVYHFVAVFVADVLNGQDQVEVFAHRELFLTRIHLRTVSDLLADFRNVLSVEFHALDGHLARSRQDLRQHDFEERRLACPVAAEHHEAVTLLDVEGHAFECEFVVGLLDLAREQEV